MEKLDLEMLHTVTPVEFQHLLDTLSEEARTGNVPLRIRAEDGSSDLLLFAWDDFFERFHEIALRILPTRTASDPTSLLQRECEAAHCRFWLLPSVHRSAAGILPA